MDRLDWRIGLVGRWSWIVDEYYEWDGGSDVSFADVFAEFGDDGCVVAESGPRLLRSARFDDRYYADRESAVWALALRLADEVERELYTRRMPADSRRRLERTLGCVVVNFLRVRLCDPGRYLAVPLRSDRYSRSTVVSYRSVSEGFKGLQQLGYVRKFTGKQSAAAGVHGLVTRFEALEPLLTLFAEYKLGPCDIKCREESALIELRISGKERRRLDAKRERERQIAKKRGQPPPPRRTSEENSLPWPRAHREPRIRMGQNLRRLNTARRAQFAALCVPDSAFPEMHKHMREENQFIDYFDTDLHRVFTIDPTKNGRFAGGWSSTLPKQYRKHIRMSGPDLPPGRTVELDFSELHLRILYSETDAPCPEAPYELYSDAALNAAIRAPVKLLTLIMLNVDSPGSAKRAMNKKVMEKFDRRWDTENATLDRPKMTVDEMASRLWPGCPPIKVLMAKILEKHAAIAESFNSGAGVELMHEDSQMAEAIMLRMLDLYGLSVLPLHDGFVVRRDYMLELEEIMKDEFRQRFGAEIEVKRSFDHGTAFPTPDYYRKQSADDAAASRWFDYECERSECGIYHALLDDWISRQPEANQPVAVAKAFADSDSSVHWAVGRITALHAGRLAVAA